jgi:hypothetical protein
MEENTFVGTCASDTHAHIASGADVMSYGTTPFIRITELCPTGSMRNGDAEIPLTNGIFETTHVVLTFVRLVSNSKEALIVRANIVVATAVIVGCTLIICIAGDDDALMLSITFGVLSTATSIGGITFVGACSGDGDTKILLTHHVLATGYEGGAITAI